MTPHTSINNLVSSIEFWFRSIAVAGDIEDVCGYAAGLDELAPGEIDKLIADIFAQPGRSPGVE
jgi:hypothetical protein